MRSKGSKISRVSAKAPRKTDKEAQTITDAAAQTAPDRMGRRRKSKNSGKKYGKRG